MPHARAATLPEPALASAFYADVLRRLTDGGVRFLVGGALALTFHTGRQRPTKDMDLFVQRGDWSLIEQTL
ncbi:MAG TPA: nucleotidyltransferase, partial [Ideonella sp.]|nr:nucleotidyltransferase [Ideonella sp.]